MEFKEYISPEYLKNPKRVYLVEVKREECYYINKIERKRAGIITPIELIGIKIDEIDFLGVYQLNNDDKFLYLTDGHGNPTIKSCFKLID